MRTDRKLQLWFTPLYTFNQTILKISYLNALHKHIHDVRRDINYISADLAMFLETRFSLFDDDVMYSIDSLNTDFTDFTAIKISTRQELESIPRQELLPVYFVLR